MLSITMEAMTAAQLNPSVTYSPVEISRFRYTTFGTCGLNSTALCIASTAFISAVLKPLLEAISGENLKKMRMISSCLA